MTMTAQQLYPNADLVVRRAGGLFEVVRSRFHARGDLLTAPAFNAARDLTTAAKVVILPERETQP